KLEYDINTSNWLIIEPTFSFRKGQSSNSSALEQTGALRQDQRNNSDNNNKTPNYGLKLNYGRKLNEKGTTLSLQINTNNNNTNQERIAINNISYFDYINGSLLKDSLLHRNINVDNLNENYRGSLTFSHPVSEKSRLEFNGQVNYRGYDNNQVTNVLNADGNFYVIDSLSRIFNYSFTESRFALNYRFTQTKYNFSLGLTAIPGVLKGFSQTLNSETYRSSFNLVPIFRFEYKWSRQKNFSVYYTGNPTEPSYEQIQDVPDVTNPQNIVVGNPDLKAAFRHSIQARFNNYITNSKLNYYAGLNTTYYENQIIRNVVFVPDDFNSRKRETRFINSSGNYTYRGNYGISKRLADNKYTIGLNGTIGFNRTMSMNDYVRNVGKNWDFNQRFNFQIDPNEWLEINPNV
ncbi:TonB-dependent receptor, partial [Pseudoxanthomonas sp. SGD-10]